MNGEPGGIANTTPLSVECVYEWRGAENGDRGKHAQQSTYPRGEVATYTGVEMEGHVPLVRTKSYTHSTQTQNMTRIDDTVAGTTECSANVGR